MTDHAETRKVPYSARQMFDLVSDVESYPEFLPWVAGARTRGENDEGRPFEADLVISFKVFRESYTSRIVEYPPDSHDPARIEVEAISGPFEKLVTHYSFHDIEGGGSEMQFSVDFRFKNRLLQRAAGAAFNHAMGRVAKAFEKRAAELYGAPENA